MSLPHPSVDHVISVVELERIRVELEHNLAGLEGRLSAPAEADDISLAIRHRTEVARDEAQEAIRKIDAGVYGACELCAAPISFDRLEAMPTTRHCRACAT